MNESRLKIHPVVAVCAPLLVLAVGFQVWSALFFAPVLTTRAPLKDALPVALAGAVGKDEPIPSSEEMKEAVTELLNYDDALFRIYQLPRFRVSVYVAWWQVGKMSPRLLAAHTPDVCWPGNGWERDYRAESLNGSVQAGLNSLGIHSGEVRIFTARGRPEHVVFWHRVGDTFWSYNTEGAPPWWAFLHELVRHGLNMKREQLFVRISSDVPMALLLADSDLQPLWGALKREGLGR